MDFYKIAHEAFLDELEKIGASALRRNITMSSAGGNSVASLFGKPIGALNVQGGHVHGAALDPSFQGMGLGKKLYGETIRRQPGATLMSDTQGTSRSAQRVWQGMSQRPGYQVQVTPGFENRGTVTAPNYRRTSIEPAGPDNSHAFSASLPTQAQLPKAPRATPDVREGMNALYEQAHVGGQSAPVDPLHQRINTRVPGPRVKSDFLPKVAADKTAVSTERLRIVAGGRTGVRPISVDKFLKKEKDGTLYKHTGDGQKVADAGATILPFQAGPFDPGEARRPKKKGDVPTKDDNDVVDLRDGRDAVVTIEGGGKLQDSLGGY